MLQINFDYDLSWSFNKKADAPTLIKHVRQDVSKHMNLITTNMQKIDNVLRALNEGNSTLRNILCKDCKHAIRSKRSQIHAGNGPTYKKRALKMLPPERLHIVTEITNMLIQLERSKSEDNEEEYCTQEEYYQQEIMETKQRYQEELDNLRLEMENMKKEMNVQQEEKRKALKKSTTEMEDFKRRNEELTRKLKSYELDNQKLKRENDKKDEELRKNRRPSSGYRSFLVDKKDADFKCLNEELQKNVVDLDKTEGYLRDISALQTEKQTLEDTLTRTKEEMASATESMQQEIDRLNTELQEMNNELGKVRGENVENKREVSILQAEKQRRISYTTEKLQREVDSLTAELEKAKNDLEKAQGEREEYKKEIFEQQAEKQTLTDTLKRTEEDMSSNTERLQQDVDRLMQELEKNKDELKELKEGNKRHELEILEREDEKQTLQETLNTTKDEMSSTNKNLQREVDRLTEALEKNKDELKEETKRHEQEISEREDEKQTLQETLNKTMDEMSSTKKNLQQEVDRLTEALAGKDAETKKLKDALEESQCLRREVVEKKNEELHIAHEENRLLKRKVLVMRMLRSSGLGKTMADIVTKDLTRRLDGRFDSRYVDFSAVQGETTASVLPGVLFVMCMNQPNQIAKHIQDAVLLGTKDRRDVYVLVISNTTKENLAQLTPTRDRVSSELQPSGIIDMAFSSDKGLYECDLNKSAINRIEAILNKL